MTTNQPFHPDDLSRLEQQFNITLPPSQRAVLLNYPFASGSSPYAWDLMADIHWLIEKNRYCRIHGFFGKSWPNDYLVIGGDGTGNLYFIDLSQRNSPVFFADHEVTARSDKLEAEDEAPNIGAWVKHLQELQEEAEQIEE